MKKIFGILGLLIAVLIFTAVIEPRFLTAYNLQNTIRWTSLFGIISIGAAFVIITGGIDLSVGSVIGLVGVLLPMMLVNLGWSVLRPPCLQYLLASLCHRGPTRIADYQGPAPAVCRHPYVGFCFIEDLPVG